MSFNLLSCVFACSLFFCCFSGFMQENNSNKEQFICRVLNEETKTPVYYATVKLTNSNRGTIADDTGMFRIPDLGDGVTLEISSIGYKTKQVFLDTLKISIVNTIYLLPKVDALETVVIREGKKLSGREIVKKAIQNIPNNLSKTPFSYVSYYRDYQRPVGDKYQMMTLQKDNVNYVNLREGIVEIFDAGLGTDFYKDVQNQIAIYKYDLNNNFHVDSLLTIPYDNQEKKYVNNVVISPMGGNELNILHLINSIRNYDKMSFSFANVFKNEFLKNHRFRKEGVEYIDNEALYKVNFEAKKDQVGEFYKANGSIYISRDSFAIYQLNYTVSDLKHKEDSYSIMISYKEVDEKMYLNYMTFANRFEVGLRGLFKIEKTIFNRKHRRFTVKLNRLLSPKSIGRKNIKVSYKGKKLVIDEVLVKKDEISILVSEKGLPLQMVMSDESLEQNIDLVFSGIEDLNGNVLGEIPTIPVKQYREIFVQEVFRNKRVDHDLFWAKKNVPLSYSKVNSDQYQEKYWENTPLQQDEL